MGNINCPDLGVKSGGVDSVIRNTNTILQTVNFVPPPPDALLEPVILETVVVIVT